nr:hypothetical protein [Tanacetum cinerariifolium]
KAILSGANNRPPMLEKDMYDSWKSIMELYMMNRQRGQMILESIKNGPFIWHMIEENGVTRPRKYSKLTSSEAIQDDCNVKATNIILQRLPPEVYNPDKVDNNMINQVINCTKINLDNKSVNDTLTTKLERYKEQVKVLKEGKNGKVESRDNFSDSHEQNAEIDRLKQTLSEQLQEKESLMKTVIILRNDFKKEESINIDREIALENKIKYLDNIVYKRDQSAQTVHMLTKPKFFYDHATKQALGFQNPFYLKKAQQLEPKLYDGNVIKNTCAMVIPDSEETLMLAEETQQLEPKLYDGNVIKNTCAMVIPDSEETLMLAEESRLKMILKQQDLIVLEKKNSMNSLDPNLSKRPTEVEVPKELPKLSMVNTSLKKLKHHLAGFDVKTSKRKVWKPTGKVFTKIGYTWRPTGWTFTIVGNVCPLTRITTTAEVPLRNPTTLEMDTHTPVVTLVYSRKPKKSKTSVPSKHKIIKSKSANNKEPSKSWGFIVSGVPSSSLDKCRNDHVAKIMGYGDYQIGNLTISRDILLQPLFDELLTPPPSVDLPDPEVIALIAEVEAPEPAESTSLPSLINVNQDAPSLNVAHMNNDPFGILIPDNDSKSSSSDVIPTVVHTAAPNSEHVTKWTKGHPLYNIISELERPVSTRLQLHEQALFCYYDAFLTLVKPKNYTDALTQACWIKAMQEELNEFEHTPMVEKSKQDKDPQGKVVDPTRYYGMIGTLRLSTTSKPKEPTFQVSLDVFSLTPFYQAFFIFIYPNLPSQKFEDPSFEEEILAFIRKLGYSRNIKSLSDVKVEILPQPWRTFGTIINKCLSDLAYQNENKVLKKNKDMYYPRFTKVIINHFMEKTVQAPKDSPGKRLKATAKVAKSGKKKLPSQGLETLSKIALSEPKQMKLVTKRSKRDYHVSHKSSDDKDDDKVSESDQDDDGGDDEDDSDQVNDNANKEDDDAYDEVTQGENVEEEKLDKEEEVDELYNDVNINPEGRDTEMTDASLANSSFVSSGFISNILNPNPDACIYSILNLNIESISLIDVPVTTNDEIPPSSVTTLPPPHIPLNHPLQQTPITTPTIAPIQQKTLYKELIDTYETDKVILETYGDTVTFKRRRDDEDEDEEPSTGSNWESKRRRAGEEPESISAPKEKRSKSTGSSKKGSKSKTRSTDKSDQAGEEVHIVKDLEEHAHQEFKTGFTEDHTIDEITQHPDWESARDVYLRNIIIAIKKLMIVEWHNYKHLEWITVHRDDDKLYTFKEGNYNKLCLQDIEDMLLLLVQVKEQKVNEEPGKIHWWEIVRGRPSAAGKDHMI